MTRSTAYPTSTRASSARPRARFLGIVQALVFLGLGVRCLFAPHKVKRLSLKPEYRHLSATTAFLMSSFGAQVILCGTLMPVARFTA